VHRSRLRSDQSTNDAAFSVLRKTIVEGNKQRHERHHDHKRLTSHQSKSAARQSLDELNNRQRRKQHQTLPSAQDITRK
jgi:hypothetical protein